MAPEQPAVLPRSAELHRGGRDHDQTVEVLLGERQQALAGFKNRTTRVLVATDIAARGIDIDNISHVINFELPRDPEIHVHRIGRTGRAGERGLARTGLLECAGPL